MNTQIEQPKKFRRSEKSKKEKLKKQQEEYKMTRSGYAEFAPSAWLKSR